MVDGLFDAAPPDPPPSLPPAAPAADPAPPVPTAPRRPGSSEEPAGLPSGASERRCARPTCSRRAGATMTYDYASRTVWIDALAEVSMPQGYDLCADHADRLGVPQGWSSTDRRPTFVSHRLAG